MQFIRFLNIKEMKVISAVILLFLACLLESCIYGGEDSEPAIYLSGGQFIFYDYDVIPISKVDGVSYLKSDTISLNTVNGEAIVSGFQTMKDYYLNSPQDLRFIIGKTIWEFDSYHLYCNFTMTSRGISIGEPCWIGFPQNFLTREHEGIIIYNAYNDNIKTYYDFETNNIGVFPPSKLHLITRELTTDICLDDSTIQENVKVKVMLKFIR